MKTTFTLLIGILYISILPTHLISQSVTGTFTQGDIPTNDLSYDPGCNGPDLNTITITLPSGPNLQVTDIEIDYSMTSDGGDWRDNQRSRVEFTNTGAVESVFYSGSGIGPGTVNYNRPDVEIANGYYSSGDVLKFKMQAWRNTTNTSPSCGTEYCYVNNDSWKITVNYIEILPELGAVGIGTETPDPSAILELQSNQKGFLPPRMPDGLMQLIPSPEEGLMVYCTDCDPIGIYTRENNQWLSVKQGGTIFKLQGDVISQNDSDYNDAFVIGIDDIPGSTILSDTFMYFDHNNAAIRAGLLQNNNYWGGNNVGQYSVAFGRNTLASGYGSVAMGESTEATGDGATAMGSTASATQYAATAFGEASASGYASFSAGSGAAIGENAIAIGSNPQAQGEFSVAIGQSVRAPSWGETVLGNYSDIYLPNSNVAPNDFDRLFSIGNGTSSANRSNAMTVLQNGNVGIARTFPESKLDVNGALKIRSGNYLEMGAGLTKATDAGKIIYEDSRMKIYGGGFTTGQRRIDLYADQGTYVYGELRLQGDNDFFIDRGIGEHTFQILASEGPGEGSELTMYNDSGTRTIEIDADFGVNKRGRIITDEIEIKGGADLAEYFDIGKKNGSISPGYVVSIDPNQEGKLLLSNAKYDKKVLGVISGANGIDPGMMMGQAGTMAYGEHAVSLIGRVYVKCNLEGGEIQPGDFLTTSSIKGEAMKVKKMKHAQGAILGKALSSIDPETGFVLVFINLQ